MRCVWCGLETSTRKDGKVFFCVKCNKPLVFELEDDYVEVIKASDFHFPQQQPQQQQQPQPQQPQSQQLQQQQEQQQHQPQEQLQEQPRRGQKKPQKQPQQLQGQTTLFAWGDAL